MKRENWIWMPHPAHFICATDCRYFLATYVGKYIVSTIGEMWGDSQVRRIEAECTDKEWYEKNKNLKGDYYDSAHKKRFGFRDIGFDRKYETMVFKAKKVDGSCGCKYHQLNGVELDFKGTNDPSEAYKFHIELCNKWSNK